MVRGDGSGTLERFPIRLLARYGFEYGMTAGHTANVKPPIIGLRQLQAQIVVVSIGATDQHRPTPRQTVLNQPETAFIRRQLCLGHAAWPVYSKNGLARDFPVLLVARKIRDGVKQKKGGNLPPFFVFWECLRS